MSKPLLQVSDRVLRLVTTDIAAAPADQAEPHFVQSPTVEGLPTRGFGFALVAPDSASPNVAAIPIGGGFAITVHRLIPSLGVYCAGVAKAGVKYKQQYVNYDMGGAQALYFSVDPTSIVVDGDILLCFTELP